MPRIVRVLERCKQRDVSQDYTYYGLASPWLQVKCLRVLQYFPPPEEPAVHRMLVDVIQRILGGGRSGVGWGGRWFAREAAQLKGEGSTAGDKQIGAQDEKGCLMGWARGTVVG